MRKRAALLIVCFAAVLASTGRAQTSGVNDAELNGNYAFTFRGISGNGTVSSAFGAVGRFKADGAGHVTNGGMETNTASGGKAAPYITRANSLSHHNHAPHTMTQY